MKHTLKDAKCLVIKIGSSLLVDDVRGTIHQHWLESLSQDIAKLHAAGKRIIIVSSGSIAIGRRLLELPARKLPLEHKQAAAAAGQVRLMHAYQEHLSHHDISIAQILLTLDDSESRKRYLNARNTLNALLDLKVIPIINENDTVATSEIRYGDNDRLSARVAQMVGADALILLSDIDGLYTANPRIDSKAKLIPEVTEMNAGIEAMAGESGTEYGSGGMKTKLAAAKIVMASGCKMVICDGRKENPISELQKKSICTWFLPAISPRNARKNWLAQHLSPKGTLTIDSGAVDALQNGRSLLSVGVNAVDGEFSKGDPVHIQNQHQQELARGLCNYSAHEARLIMGQKSSEFQQILGYDGSDEIIHRDNLVLI